MDGNKALTLDFEALVGKAFDGFYRMNVGRSGGHEDIGFRLRLLEVFGEEKDGLCPFVASMRESGRGLYALRGKLTKSPSGPFWGLDFRKEQKQWDPYDNSCFNFDGNIENTESGLLVVKKGEVIHYRPASIQGAQLLYAEHNKGLFEMTETSD